MKKGVRMMLVKNIRPVAIIGLGAGVMRMIIEAKEATLIPKSRTMKIRVREMGIEVVLL